MEALNDSALLRRYVEQRSDDAFTELVHRHLNLVYSVALRQVGNAHFAEEIAQAVFIVLARKAPSLRSEKALGSWLFQTTRLTAINFVRSEQRRRHREHQAFMEAEQNESQANLWTHLAPILDSAVGALREKDRRAIVLRFYEGKNLREVGSSLGLSEDAAGKRVARALEKLHTLLSKQAAMPGTEDIAAAIASHSVQLAPATLAKAVATVAIAKGASAGTFTLTLVKGVTKIMAWSKIQTAALIGLGILATVGTAGVAVEKIHEAQVDDSWRMGDADTRVLEAAKPQVRILPARGKRLSFVSNGHDWMGIGCDVTTIIASAYQKNRTRVVLPPNTPTNRYDYIAKLADRTDARPALRKEIERKFGLRGHNEYQVRDVLVLTVEDANAPGLQPAGNPTVSINRIGQSGITLSGVPVMVLASQLERILGTPVIDRTGLVGSYDLSVFWRTANLRQQDLGAVQQRLLDQLGLRLAPSREPIEVLVVTRD